MAVTVFLSATLRNHVPDYDPVGGIQVEVEEGVTIRQLCSLLNIPERAIKIAMVNGVKVELDHKLEGEERVGLFPAVGGG